MSIYTYFPFSASNQKTSRREKRNHIKKTNNLNQNWYQCVLIFTKYIIVQNDSMIIIIFFCSIVKKDKIETRKCVSMEIERACVEWKLWIIPKKEPNTDKFDQSVNKRIEIYASNEFVDRMSFSGSHIQQNYYTDWSKSWLTKSKIDNLLNF